MQINFDFEHHYLYLGNLDWNCPVIVDIKTNNGFWRSLSLSLHVALCVCVCIPMFICLPASSFILLSLFSFLTLLSSFIRSLSFSLFSFSPPTSTPALIHIFIFHHILNVYLSHIFMFIFIYLYYIFNYIFIYLMYIFIYHALNSLLVHNLNELYKVFLITHKVRNPCRHQSFKLSSKSISPPD